MTFSINPPSNCLITGSEEMILFFKFLIRAWIIMIVREGAVV